MESLFIQICNAGKSIIVGVVYKPPNVDLPSFNTAFGNLLARLHSERKPCYLLGDFNINLLNTDKHRETENFLNLLYAHGFYPLIDKPTRITPNSSTLIDNILTNVHPSSIKNSSIWITDISDHLPVCCSTYISHNKPRLEMNSLLFKRMVTDDSLSRFKQKLALVEWDSTGNCEVNVAFDDFLNKFTQCYNLCFPPRRVGGKTNSTDLPWLTSALKKSIKKKNLMY